MTVTDLCMAFVIAILIVIPTATIAVKLIERVRK